VAPFRARIAHRRSRVRGTSTSKLWRPDGLFISAANPSPPRPCLQYESPGRLSSEPSSLQSSRPTPKTGTTLSNRGPGPQASWSPRSAWRRPKEWCRVSGIKRSRLFPVSRRPAPPRMRLRSWRWDGPAPGYLTLPLPRNPFALLSGQNFMDLKACGPGSQPWVPESNRSRAGRGLFGRL